MNSLIINGKEIILKKDRELIVESNKDKTFVLLLHITKIHNNIRYYALIIKFDDMIELIEKIKYLSGEELLYCNFPNVLMKLSFYEIEDIQCGYIDLKTTSNIFKKFGFNIISNIDNLDYKILYKN